MTGCKKIMMVNISANKINIGSSTVEEFISVVCQADEVLTKKITNSKNYLEDFHR